MPKATVSLKDGTTVTIEGNQEEVAQMLVDFERLRGVGEVKKQVSVEKKKNKEVKKRATASDLIIEVKEEGFFDTPKTLNEIVEALEGRGYIYPATTLSAVVIGLVQEKLLGRKKIEGKWVYGK
jgi:hypothetical protein